MEASFLFLCSSLRCKLLFNDGHCSWPSCWMLTTMTFFINEARLLLIVINNFLLEFKNSCKEKGSVLLFFHYIIRRQR